MLFREYHLLRQGLWKHLKRANLEDATETIIRIDSEITMATAVSLHGLVTSPDDVDDDALVEELAKRWST